MENFQTSIKMDKAEKKIAYISSLLPTLAWLIAFAYFLFINRELIITGTFQNQKGIATNISIHYLPLTIFLSVAALITGILPN